MGFGGRGVGAGGDHTALQGMPGRRRACAQVVWDGMFGGSALSRTPRFKADTAEGRMLACGVLCAHRSPRHACRQTARGKGGRHEEASSRLRETVPTGTAKTGGIIIQPHPKANKQPPKGTRRVRCTAGPVHRYSDSVPDPVMEPNSDPDSGLVPDCCASTHAQCSPATSESCRMRTMSAWPLAVAARSAALPRAFAHARCSTPVTAGSSSSSTTSAWPLAAAICNALLSCASACARFFSPVTLSSSSSRTMSVRPFFTATHSAALSLASARARYFSPVTSGSSSSRTMSV
eukprot:366158-Chlamydomonas_euryale.AAC.4